MLRTRNNLCVFFLQNHWNMDVRIPQIVDSHRKVDLFKVVFELPPLDLGALLLAVVLVHLAIVLVQGISPQSCTETDFEMKTSNLVLFLLISVVSVHFRAIDDETIPCQA